MSDNSNATFDITSPPEGAWITQQSNSLILGANNRTQLGYFFVPFMTAWTLHFIKTLVTQEFFYSFQNQSILNTWGALALSIIVGAIFWVKALYMLWGKIELTIEPTQVVIFVGVFNWGRKQIFNLDDLEIVEAANATWNKKKYLVLTLNKNKIIGTRVSFNPMLDLNQTNQNYLLMALSKVKEDKKLGKFYLQQTQEIASDLDEHLIDNSSNL